MSITEKLEKDPYYSTGSYLVDIFKYAEENNFDHAQKIISDAKLFDTKYYEGEFPRYEDITLLFVELDRLDLAKDILLDVKKNSDKFFVRGYLDLFEINKKMGLKDENAALLKEALEKDPINFFDFGYKKLIEMYIEEKNFEGALKVLLKARDMQLQNLNEENKNAYNALSPERKKTHFTSLEDYNLYLELTDLING